MKKTNKELDKSKRDFIKKSTLAGAGVVAASVVVNGAAVADVSVDDKKARQDKGYQLTPHVLEYYKSAAS